MSLRLHVDGPRWRKHVRAFVEHEGPTVVPVTKGNGYGFGNAVLAAEAAALGAPALAVGTYRELADVAPFPGDVVVLTPWRPGVGTATVGGGDDRVIHTVSHLDDLRPISTELDRPRVLLEILTSMRRHGLHPDEVGDAVRALDDVGFEGFALHLPLTGDHRDEAHTLGVRALAAAEAVGVRTRTLWVSHLSTADAARLATDAGVDVRLRVATALWLGDRQALEPRATVLDAHRVARGDRYGYRQRRAPSDGTILVVSGGTAHGIALEAPTPASNARQRAVSLAKGGLEAVGRALSPYYVDGKQRWFAEPPHMQCSLIWLPADVEPPARGDEVRVDVRFTTTTFDEIVWHD